MGSSKKKKAVTRIALEGELAIYTAAEIKEKLSAALLAEQPLEIDLSQIGEMDTAGLQLLLLAQRESAARKQPISFLNPSQAVLDTLQLCGLTELVTQTADSAA